MDDNDDNMEETDGGGSALTWVVGLHGGPLTVNQHQIIQNLVEKHISALTEYAKQWKKPADLLLRTANCMITMKNH